MSGVVGWVDFGRVLTGESPVIRAMTAAMALRGPDAERIWVDRHVALGHRRLAVIDAVGGAQPMAVEHDGAPVAVATFNGRVYNAPELREELRRSGERFRTGSDVEVVLRAYLRWGDTFAEHLDGAYGFGLWDCTRQRLVLVRDRLGVKPLFYRRTPDGALFASEPKGILAHPGVPTEVDADGLRQVLVRAKAPGRSVYRGLREVLPGQVVVVDHAGLHQYRYWSLPVREHPDDLDTTVRRVRELLEDIVARQVVADVPVGTLLSGGLDSSTVTALAAAASRPERPAAGRRATGPVRAFSVDFAGQTENFRPDPTREEPDAPFADAVAAHLAVEYSGIVLDSAAMTDPLYRAAMVVAKDAPSIMGDMATSGYLLFRAVREYRRVVLCGEVADILFDDYERQAVSVSTLGASMNAASGGADPLIDVLDPDLAALLDLPGYEADLRREAMSEFEAIAEKGTPERRARGRFYLRLTRRAPVIVNRLDRLSAAHGVEARLPFCDHRLVEYCYNTPSSMQSFDGGRRACSAPRSPTCCRSRSCAAERAPIRPFRTRGTGGSCGSARPGSSPTPVGRALRCSTPSDCSTFSTRHRNTTVSASTDAGSSWSSASTTGSAGTRCGCG